MHIGEMQDILLLVIVEFPNGYLPAQKQMAAKWKLPAVICSPSAMEK